VTLNDLGGGEGHDGVGVIVRLTVDRRRRVAPFAITLRSQHKPTLCMSVIVALAPVKQWGKNSCPPNQVDCPQCLAI